MPRVLICSGPLIPSLLPPRRQSFSIAEPSPASVFWILSFLSSQQALTVDCLSAMFWRHSWLCFYSPLCGDESQIYTSSQDLLRSSRSCTISCLVLRILAINILCEGHAPSCHGIIGLAVPLTGNLFSLLFATAHSSSCTSGRPNYLINV